MKSSNGNISLRHVAGDLKVKAANGRIDVERVDRSVVSKTANGTTRIGQVGEGDVLVTAAVRRHADRHPARDRRLARSALPVRHGAQRARATTGQPTADDRRVKVTAKTYNGDVVVHRAHPVVPATT